MKSVRLLLAFLLLGARPALGAEPPPPTPAPAPPPAPNESAEVRSLLLSFDATSAFGVAQGKFFNQLLGARLDYRVTPRFAFGGGLSYANLKGAHGRVSNLLPEVTTEYRVPLDRGSVGLPLRLGLGFLPKNGPSVRFGIGFDFALGDRLLLELTPLEPMLWVTFDRPELSFDAHVAARISL